jgi:hypothetical protein
VVDNADIVMNSPFAVKLGVLLKINELFIIEVPERVLDYLRARI